MQLLIMHLCFRLMQPEKGSPVSWTTDFWFNPPKSEDLPFSQVLSKTHLVNSVSMSNPYPLASHYKVDDKECYGNALLPALVRLITASAVMHEVR